MKKSNPLKYFNDQADARRKTVTEGNKKLVKAQVGVALPPPSLENTGQIVFQGPLDQEASGRLDEKYPSTSGKGQMPRQRQSNTYTEERLMKPFNMGPGTAEMYKRNLAENDLRGERWGKTSKDRIKKKGGSVNSKKRK